MTRKFKMTAAALAALAVMPAAGTAAAFAAEDTADSAAAYGYLAGQQQNSGRKALFEQAAGFAADAEREAFFTAQGIGGDGPYSTEPHPDTGELAAAGIIDQETAGRIAAYASEKHLAIHSRYDGKAGMTPEDRSAFYEGLTETSPGGGPADELLRAGIITQEQADAVNAGIE